MAEIIVIPALKNAYFGPLLDLTSTYIFQGPRDDDVPIMGYEDIKYLGSCKEWPSSSKAELVAILTALITYPPESNVQIHTDSASCINTFNSLYSPKLTARRFQKLNNCGLWNTIKHIINTLKLKVSLHKVKVHSGHPLNDTADSLAKEGLSSKEFLQINIQHIKTQACYLRFNNEINIDRNIHKTIKHWEYSQLWFKYNSFIKPTSDQYTKHISWRIKCSSNQLPTLDILNRNYSELLNDNNTCFLCLNHIETNEHFWNCPKVLDIITPIFTEFYEKFKTLITLESNSLYALYLDSITRNPIFKWTKKISFQIIDVPELHCLLMNFIPSDLTYPFKAAKISKDTTKRILLKFIFDLHKEIYENIWKQRAIKWKQFKKDYNITKKSFINY
ncbi:hypothetical protein RhiirA1_465969 [Rhizophagus irregularis]|uniref:RNase H type-1 domain-containing protein n=1 Tax=Rhizophagus irregularis TaxID=588596 RepID=A0A2N0RET9_9GLOM|nr:hypothetical protein RhiirA1_465969 [Rhizophagus irregularis]